MSIPTVDGHGLVDYNPDSYAHKFATTALVLVDEGFIGEPELVQRRVLVCSMCPNLVRDYGNRRHYVSSTCSEACDRIEDELCDAANERYYAGP